MISMDLSCQSVFPPLLDLGISSSLKSHPSPLFSVPPSHGGANWPPVSRMNTWLNTVNQTTTFPQCRCLNVCISPQIHRSLPNTQCHSFREVAAPSSQEGDAYCPNKCLRELVHAFHYGRIQVEGALFKVNQGATFAVSGSRRSKCLFLQGLCISSPNRLNKLLSNRDQWCVSILSGTNAFCQWS